MRLRLRLVRDTLSPSCRAPVSLCGSPVRRTALIGLKNSTFSRLTRDVTRIWFLPRPEIWGGLATRAAAQARGPMWINLNPYATGWSSVSKYANRLLIASRRENSAVHRGRAVSAWVAPDKRFVVPRKGRARPVRSRRSRPAHRTAVVQFGRQPRLTTRLAAAKERESNSRGVGLAALGNVKTDLRFSIGHQRNRHFPRSPRAVACP